MTLPFNFTLKQIEFSYDPHRECFHHNLERDFHFFCVWEKARHLEKDIVRFLSEKFACVHVDEIAWSLDLCELNFARLYKWSNTESNGKARAVGTGPFLCILIEDTHPNYQYELSVSGVLELCNRNVLEAKREIRRWLGDYLVHSTGNPSELIEQASLFYPMAGSQQCSEQVEQTGFGNRPHIRIGVVVPEQQAGGPRHGIVLSIASTQVRPRPAGSTSRFG